MRILGEAEPYEEEKDEKERQDRKDRELPCFIRSQGERDLLVSRSRS